MTYNFKDYIDNIQNNLRVGNSTEHTHRLALQNLIQSFARGITATNEPKRIACGAPDYIITKSTIPLGYIEAKDVGKCLNSVERSKQIKRYLGSLNNLIITDYLEFRWYVGGEKRLATKLANEIQSQHGSGTSRGNTEVSERQRKLKLEPKGAEELTKILNGFLTVEVPTVNSPKELAQKMAKQAQLIRDLISNALKEDRENSKLRSQLESFRQVLLRDLSNEQFADMYAQTITYGMFTARYNTNNIQGFNRQSAAYELPKTNPFLRQTFGNIAGFDLDDRITWIVDDLAEMLRRTDMAAILQDFGKKTRTEDPIVYFYENFLAEYDPKLRKSRGVYYTPEPVVSYLVRSVDYILKQDFGITEGLADSSKVEVPNPHGKGTIESHKVLILDPAIGTGTFLAKAIDLIADSFKHNKGMWSGYVKKHLLPRLFGFELMMAAYTVAHLKLGLKLKENGYQFDSEERLGVFLTNTLEKGFQITLPDGFTKWIKDESDAAKEIKQDSPVMVIMGNPPYAGNSKNNGDWIKNLLRGKDTITEQITSNYFEVDGKPLGERNPKYLNDDYVKFIRFAQWRIAKTGYGILAFVTNHGYLDNPTFRGMRESLLETFDDIYVLDLHGSSKKKESCPDGTKDENVFDIQQGVAISIFVKCPDSNKKLANVHHTHLWGVREEFEGKGKNKDLVGGKYYWLEKNDLSTTQWTEISPQSPDYFFVPQDTKYQEEYQQGWYLKDVFPINSMGITTGDDRQYVAFHDRELEQRFNHSDSKYISEIDYRPFDTRNILYKSELIDRPRNKFMKHFSNHKNLSIATVRRPRNNRIGNFLVCNKFTDKCVISSLDNAQLFVLYIYPETKLEIDMGITRRPNLSQEFINDFSIKLELKFIPDGKGDREKTFAPEDIFAYMYAVFHSPIYRQRYGEFLKTDFPRLPLTSNSKLFKNICNLGDRLIELHLMEKQGDNITNYPIEGDNIVEKVRYSEPTLEELGKIWINKNQYFAGVHQQVWDFYIGGYQVCHKWLKDRKGRQLSYEDLSHYQNIISAISETIDLMNNIDLAIQKNGGFPIK